MNVVRIICVGEQFPNEQKKKDNILNDYEFNQIHWDCNQMCTTIETIMKSHKTNVLTLHHFIFGRIFSCYFFDWTANHLRNEILVKIV